MPFLLSGLRLELVQRDPGLQQGFAIAHIAGMDQPDNGLFDFHLSCTATRADGESKSSLIYGCNSLPEGRGASCVGGLEGRAGTLKGMRGVITMHLGAKGASVGTGQWIE